jgi:ketosteroid isomerase-like protein
VAERFFGSLMPSFTSFGAVPGDIYGDGDHVFVLGHYHAVRPSGAEADVRFAHIWTVTDGKLVHLSQIADSQVLRDLLEA